ncbi:hypothetical protein HYV69_00840 [Candidatus Uhrbacteria bacterium]|nr:hypothetical protein [Candidatus Uhrbacteria bacterium]
MSIESKLNRGPVIRPMGQSEEKKKSNPWVWIIVILTIIVAGALWWYRSATSPGDPSASLGMTSIEYQAVFLDNGQVYFGKLKKSGEDFYELTDVFYLQTGAVGIDQASNLSLAKLGNEAHGPEDKMQINKDHVLFIEDMKSESKVVKAIQDYYSKKE